MNCGGKSRRVVCAVAVTTLWGLFCAIPATATITAIGDIDPVYDNSDPWILPGDLIIGNTADASVTLSDGSWLQNRQTILGVSPAGTGTMTVTGPGTIWGSLDSIHVGERGHGDLIISDGGEAGGEITVMGNEAGSTGVALVTGSGTILRADNCYVGYYGQGSLSIADGARVEGTVGHIGVRPGGMGAVTVAGPNSVWDNTAAVLIGTEGSGTLTIQDGGRVVGPSGYMGAWPGSSAAAIVTGSGSVWEASTVLYVGGDATGARGTASLGLYDGGLVDAGTVYIWQGSVLTGDGTLRADTVFNHGVIRPGASMGVLTIDGDLTLSPDSALEIEIDNSGNSDKVVVTGQFTPGTAHVRPIGTETIVGEHQYAVVEADSVNWPQITVVNQFDTALLRSTFTPGSPAEPNVAMLNVAAVPFDNASIARTARQRAFGSALNQIAEDGGNDITRVLQQVESVEQVRTAYDQLSGQTMSSLAPVSVAGTSRHVGMIAGRLRSPADATSNDVGLGASSAGPMAATDALGIDAGQYLFAVGNGSPVLGDRPWGVWGKGYGLYGDRESESGVPGYQYTIYGGGLGLDYRFTEQLLLGLTGGYSEGDIDNSGSRDSSDVSATYGGLYGDYETPHWYLDSILTYADLEYETHRFVDFVGERLEADPSGNMVTGYLEAGLNHWRSERTLIQPLAAFQLSTLHIDSFTESGGDSSLTFDDERYDSYRGSLGVRITRELFEHADGCRADLELRGRWVHEFGDTNASFDAAFASGPGVVFRISDEDISRDSAVLGAGLDTWFTCRTRLFLDYGTELNPDNTIHLVSAGLEHRW